MLFEVAKNRHCILNLLDKMLLHLTKVFVTKVLSFYNFPHKFLILEHYLKFPPLIESINLLNVGPLCLASGTCVIIVEEVQGSFIFHL